MRWLVLAVGILGASPSWAQVPANSAEGAAAPEPTALPTLSGRWTASALRTSWSADEWGEACGPRPSGGGEGGGSVTIAVRGSELTIVGLGRSWSTTQCWEQLPNMVVKSHSGGTRGWRTVCRSASGDSRRASIVTSLSATNSRIDLEETGTYELVTTEQTCRASVHRSRTFALVQRDGAAGAPSMPSASAPGEGVRDSAPSDAAPSDSAPAAEGPHTPEQAPPPTVDQLRTCAVPGPPARIEIRPSRKLLRSGEKFGFRARVTDAGGCTLGVTPTFRLVDATTQVDVTPGGIVTVPDSATEGEAHLSASVHGRTVPLTITVVSEAHYRQLLSGGSFTASGETREAAIATLAGAALGAGSAVAESTARKKRTVFIWTVVGLSGLLGVTALLMALRRGGGGHPSAPPSPQPTPQSTGQLLCPSCGAHYPPSQLFCPADGRSLVPASPSSVPPSLDSLVVPEALCSKAPATPNAGSGGRKICPICGTTYMSESGFCGNDGAALVPLN